MKILSITDSSSFYPWSIDISNKTINILKYVHILLWNNKKSRERTRKHCCWYSPKVFHVQNREVVLVRWCLQFQKTLIYILHEIKKSSYNSLRTMPHCEIKIWWRIPCFFVVVIVFMFCLFDVLQHVSK